MKVLKSRKKLLFYIGGAGAVILVSFLLWFWMNRKPQTVIVNGTNVNPVSYNEKQFLSKLKKMHPETYSHLYTGGDQEYYVIPGLEQTQAIVHSGSKKGQVAIAKDMDPQGMAVIGDQYIVISAYSKSQKYNSVLWLIDKKTGKYLKTLALDDIDHVGAIAYDEDHQRLWVAAVNKNHRAQAEALNLSTIENYDLKKSQKPIDFDDSSNLSDITQASYMAYHDKTLYVGYFNQTKNGILAAFPLDDSGRLVQSPGTDAEGIEPSKTWPTYNKIQGISFYEDKIIMSQSYGTKNSKLYVFDNQLYTNPNFDLDKGDAIASMTLPPYLEQIIGRNESAYLLFESASHKYRNNPDIIHMDRVIKIKIEDLYK